MLLIHYLILEKQVIYNVFHVAVNYFYFKVQIKKLIDRCEGLQHSLADSFFHLKLNPEIQIVSKLTTYQ